VALGTADVDALLVGIRSSIIPGNLAENLVLTAELKDEVYLTNLMFFSEPFLQERLAGKIATPGQLAEALAINAEAGPGAQDRLSGAVGAGAVGDLPVQLAATSRTRKILNARRIKWSPANGSPAQRMGSFDRRVP
jgi:hypothetical protein